MFSGKQQGSYTYKLAATVTVCTLSQTKAQHREGDEIANSHT